MGGVGSGTSFLTLIFLSFSFPIKTISNNNSSSNVLCIESERDALLRFKKQLQDPSNRLSSWIPRVDCCKWVGIHCDSLTGHVKELNLSNTKYGESSQLMGILSDSIVNLKHINFIDLTDNGFHGPIPHQLGNLSNLQRLHLRGNAFYSENLHWVQSLHSLVSLDLSYTDLSKASNWLLDINKLPILKELHLFGCQLNHNMPLSHINFTSLSVLDISSNSFNQFIPKWILQLTNLVSLKLNYCNFQGPLPVGFSNLTSLKYLNLGSNKLNSSLPNWLFSLTSISSLDLRDNHFEGSIPCAIQNLSALTYLDLSRNNFYNSTTIPSCLYSLHNLKYLDLSFLNLQGEISNDIANLTNLVTLYLRVNELVGNIPRSIATLYNLRFISLAVNKMSGPILEYIGNLSSLEYLELFSNRFEGIVTEVHFANLKNLRMLDMSENNLTLSFSIGWIPPFNLHDIRLRSCTLGPQFPKWLESQKKLHYIDISNAKISDTVPEWFWNLSTSYGYLNLSHNQLSGKIPDFHLNGESTMITLGSNKFHGNLPLISSNVTHFDLSNNFFDGNMSQFLCHSIGQNNQLTVLHLGDNLLSGNIPDCWTKWMFLNFVSLSSNNLSGKLPPSMGSLINLWSLHLRNNSLFGMIPHTLKNCSNLINLDLGLNAFHGNIPTWIGTNLSNLVILGLRSNRLSGLIPDDLCHLSSLQIMDIGSNNLVGSIPHCFANFTAMASKENGWYDHFISFLTSPDHQLLEKAYVITKGGVFEYDKILTLMKSMDLSNNNLSGDIPQEITNLSRLKSLNLSGNNLRGSIPQRIGSMTDMESLDLSRNQLSGQIPQSISNLTSLSYLNLSYNHLLGPIPTSTQLHSFNPSSFIGNELCGQPLPNSCSTDKTTSNNTEDEEAKEGDENFIDQWFYLSLAIGFVVGFWGIWGPLLISRTWRHTYFSHVSSLWHKFN